MKSIIYLFLPEQNWKTECWISHELVLYCGRFLVSWVLEFIGLIWNSPIFLFHLIHASQGWQELHNSNVYLVFWNLLPLPASHQLWPHECFINNSFTKSSSLFIPDLPDPVSNCTAYNSTAYSIQIACMPGNDGGIKQHFHIEVNYLYFHDDERNM